MQKEKKKKTKEDEAPNQEGVIVEAEDKAFISIDKLQDHGINAGDINKLKQAGVCTVKGLLMITKKEILSIKGISEQKLEKMVEAAQKIDQQMFVSANDILVKREKIKRLSTGSKAFDDLLCGGVESQAITEVFGEYRTGKTQLCLTLCVTCQLGNTPGKAIYIDTENTL